MHKVFLHCTWSLVILGMDPNILESNSHYHQDSATVHLSIMCKLHQTTDHRCHKQPTFHHLHRLYYTVLSFFFEPDFFLVFSLQLRFEFVVFFSKTSQAPHLGFFRMVNPKDVVALDEGFKRQVSTFNIVYGNKSML